MDALSDMLRLVGLTGGVFLDASFTAPWAVAGKVAPGVCAAFMVEPREIVGFHYVLEGEFELEVVGHSPVRISAGQAVMLPRNDMHTLASRQGLPAIPMSNLIAPTENQGMPVLEHGGGGAPCRLICGFMGGNENLGVLLSGLPAIMVLDVAAMPGGAWIGQTFAHAAQTGRDFDPGAATVLTKLSELLFVECVRHYLGTLGPSEIGWLAALRDPVIGRALALLHSRVADPWTADMLASAVNMSRSAFADRFGAIVGQPPMRYLTSWRMRLARQKLSDTRATIAQIAFEVGYDSEAAFARAFRRECGTPPGAWRRAAAGGRSGLDVAAGLTG